MPGIINTSDKMHENLQPQNKQLQEAATTSVLDHQRKESMLPQGRHQSHPKEADSWWAYVVKQRAMAKMQLLLEKQREKP